VTTPTSPVEAQRGVSYTARVWTWHLWGCADRRFGTVATVATLAVLAASRFALLPSGPWEWDETLFARGLLSFDLPSHFPHPPGFPLWMALGWVMLRVVGDPLLGFQFLSAAASCLTLFPLAALGRRLAPAPLAAVSALAVLFVPGVWVHAGRGFTDTAAAFFLLWAAALAVWGLDGRRATAFTLLLTASFLIRPILLPPIGVLWIAGALTVRPARRLLPGLALAIAATGVALAGLVLVQGSWAEFASSFVVHAETHARNLVEHNPGGVLDSGIVKGFGGPWLTAGAGVLALLGVAVWARRVGRRSAAAWLALLAITVAQLVWLQNRRFPRYAVPLQEAVAPLLAGTAAATGAPTVALAGVGALGAAWALRAWAPVIEQHRTTLPGWDAVRFAVRTANGTGQELVVEPGLWPFLSYQEQLDRRAGREWRLTYELAPSSPDARALPRGSYVLVTDHPFDYGPPLFGGVRWFHRVSDALRPLTQDRFLLPEVAQNVPLPVRGWYPPERDEGGAFRWGAPGAELHLPPVPDGTWVGVDLAPASGPSPLGLLVNGRAAAVVPGLGRRIVWLASGALSSHEPNRVVFARAQAYVAGGDDSRALAAQLFGVRAVGPAVPWAGSVCDEPPGNAVRARVAGVWPPEHLDGERGCWTGPVARVWLPAGEGRLRLALLAARPTPPDTEVFIRGRHVAGPLRFAPGASGAAVVDLAAGDIADGGVELELRSRPFCPAKAGTGADARELGVVLVSASYTPRVPVPGWRAFRPPADAR